MSSVEFAHLHSHSEYSLLDGAARVKDLAQRAHDLGQKAIAITDHGVLAGAIEFYQAAGDVGITPIIGCEVYVAARSHLQKEGRADRDPFHLVLLARDQQGYANLVKLVSKAHLDGFYYKPRIDHELLAEHAAGLIGLSGCIGGEVPQRLLAGDRDGALAIAREYSQILGPDGYFLEIQDHGMEEERIVREGLIEMARQTDLPLVATNDCHYVNPDDAEAHDVLLCIQTGSRLEDPKRLRFSGPHFYVSSAEEMANKFNYCLEAVNNSWAVASRCRFEPLLDQRLLPTYDVPAGQDADGLLALVASEGLRQRLHGQDPPDEYLARLSYELGVIRETGFAGYFLIVWDFTRAGREEGVKIGPGRGSSAGSLVAYSLGITNVDPLQYGLIFERFLNPERVSMPDIDIDFDVAGRARVIDYVNRRYGTDRVAQIVTYGTMAARAAVRDVGRVQNVPLPDVDQLAKLIPTRPGVTLDAALQESRELRAAYDGQPWAQRLIDTARRLEGISRNAGTHAGGVVIAPGPLTDYVPLQRATTNREAVVTQFDMDGVQKIGLLKMDFLGLENLSILEETLDNIASQRGSRPDLDAIPLDDDATYELLARGDTLGVFQLEQQGGRRIVMDMRPRCIEDMAAAVAINRPGVIEGGATDLYMKRRRGEEPITYLLPELEPILKETHGVIIYQDQVMQIAAEAAGFSLGAADLLRSAMGKKDKGKMAAQRQRFLEGAMGRGVAEKTAVDLFDYIDYFAGYGFNKAHSVAYGLISYQTAYFKAHYPLEFMAALLNSKASDFERLKRAIQDSQARGIVVHPPDINRSRAAFSVIVASSGQDGETAAKDEILYGLQHIKNVGESAAQTLVAVRLESGPFQSLIDLCTRVRGHELNRRALEALIRSGACDVLGDRGLLLAQLDNAMRRAEIEARERDSGQIALFEAETGEAATSKSEAPLWVEQSLTEEMQRERLAWEREHLGIYLSEHPLQRLSEQLSQRTDTAVSDLAKLEGSLVQVGGSVRECRRVQSRRGEAMAFAQLEDLSGVCEVVVFPSLYQRAALLLQPDGVVVIRGRVEVGARRGAPSANGANSAPNGLEGEESSDPASAEEPEEARVIAEEVLALDDPALSDWRASAVVHIRAYQAGEDELRQLSRLLQDNVGKSMVVLHLRDAEGDHELELGNEHLVTAGPGLESAVVELFGPGSYQIEAIRTMAPPPRFRGRSR
ncbi:MAG TPA: DNA polymerase III subunit alpha [Candidatus Dormibacteraeota bacterium]|nr:DNA polymerase III subunit alpha [Candidatus Dormibacteraeota bacterium]